MSQLYRVLIDSSPVVLVFAVLWLAGVLGLCIWALRGAWRS